MKCTKIFPLFILALSPFLLGAQDFLGSWTMSGVAPDGTAITNTVTFTDKGALTVDFASDGTIEVHATYTHKDGVVTMSDASAESPCYGKVGVYRMAVTGNTAKATLIKDSCDERRNDKMVMTRK